jgi:hypothetical protein
MTPIKQPLVIVGGLLAILALGMIVVTVRPGGRPMQERSTYYCPMHPGMVSDHPGDCPVCYMKLVRRETSPAMASPPQDARQMSDICYLHNCPMMKEGRPCPMLVVAKAGEQVTCPICGTHIAEAATATPPKAKKILYWTDPMIPGYRSEEPGTSPMGMDLIPVYEEHGVGLASQATAPPGYAPILVSPQKRQFIGVKTAPVERRSLTKTIRTVGLIAHDPELYQAQEEYLRALQAGKKAQVSRVPEVAERAKRLVESTRLRLRHLGLNEQLIEEVGAREEPDHRLLLGGAGQVWVYASIYEYELPLVREGQPATIDVSTVPGRTVQGTVKAIDPIVDHMTRTVRIRIIVEDPQGWLKPAMYVNVLIGTDLGEVLAVPEEAVFATGTKHIVFVDKGDGLFEPRDITVGAKADGYVEVNAGLSAREIVVTSGNFLIDSESRLQAALEGLGTDTPTTAQDASASPPAPDHIPRPSPGAESGHRAEPDHGRISGEHHHGH